MITPAVVVRGTNIDLQMLAPATAWLMCLLTSIAG